MQKRTVQALSDTKEATSGAAAGRGAAGNPHSKILEERRVRQVEVAPLCQHRLRARHRRRHRRLLRAVHAQAAVRPQLREGWKGKFG